MPDSTPWLGQVRAIPMPDGIVLLEQWQGSSWNTIQPLWLMDSENHQYLSTSCLHGKHDRCTDKGACCKFCPSECLCKCHTPGV